MMSSGSSHKNTQSSDSPVAFDKNVPAKVKGVQGDLLLPTWVLTSEERNIHSWASSQETYKYSYSSFNKLDLHNTLKQILNSNANEKMFANDGYIN